MIVRLGLVLSLAVVSCGGDGGGNAPDLVAVGIDGSGSDLTTLAFGTVAAGSSATQMFAIGNEGGGTSGLLTVTTAAPFSVSATTCELSLPPAGSCLVSIEFTPTSNTTFMETVTVAGSGDSVSVALTGSGGVQSARGD